jgi:hypothetical protein
MAKFKELVQFESRGLTQFAPVPLHSKNRAPTRRRSSGSVNVSAPSHAIGIARQAAFSFSSKLELLVFKSRPSQTGAI